MRNGLPLFALLMTVCLGGLAFVVLVSNQQDVLVSDQSEVKPKPRQPAALALADQGKWLFVANGGSGSISTVDTSTLAPVAEVAVGRKLADLAATSDGNYLLAVDEAADELILLRRRGPALEVVQRVPVSPAPVSVQVAPDGSRAFVASLWSRRLTIVELTTAAKEKAGIAARVLKTVVLPFAPRQQLPVQEGTKLIVADSFGGQLGVVDTRTGEVESVRRLPAHNIRGLALSQDGKRLLVAHQILSELASTSVPDIHWGNLMTNNLRLLDLAIVLNPKKDLLCDSHLEHLGDVGHGAADPAGVAVCPDGKVVVALSGVGEIAIAGKPGADWHYVEVGARPTALRAAPDSRTVYVANTLGDSISVIDVPARRNRAEIRLGSRSGLNQTERGELLFYSGRLSHDGWMSCHSCHTDGHSNGLLNDNLSDGSYGSPKRVLSLRGVADTGPWAWNGSMPDLETQIRTSVRTTMRGHELSVHGVQDLVTFLRTLPPPPPLGRFAEHVDQTAIERGRKVFAEQSCANCHTPPAYTSRKTHDVGTETEDDNRAFSPPSLRGVSQGDRFFHDNRAANLTEIFTRHRHQLKKELTKRQVDDLVTFLGSL